jgi:outer membrane protein assembly factor BamB
MAPDTRRLSLHLAFTAICVALAFPFGTGASSVQTGGQAPAASAAPASWPQWRGPRRDGSIGAIAVTNWPAQLTKRWEISIGSGHASPVVSGGRVIVFSREGDREIVRALELSSGREAWRADYPAPYSVNPAAAAHGPGPKATPAIAGSRVFTFGIGGVLSAFDAATGKLLWRAPAPKSLPEYGTAASPLVDGTSVIAHVGGYSAGAITAFDAATGATKWQWTGDGPGYASPVLATIGGVRQVITLTQKFVVGLSAASGALLWQLPFTTEYNQNSVTPLVRGDLVVFSGVTKPLTAVRIRREASKWTASPVWTNDQLPMYMSSPILIGDTLFGLTHRNRGQIFAADLATGRSLWTTKGRDGENASLLGNGSWMLISTTNGELLIAQPNGTAFKEIRRYTIANSAVWAHPAIAGRSIVVKDANTIICWRF